MAYLGEIRGFAFDVVYARRDRGDAARTIVAGFPGHTVANHHGIRVLDAANPELSAQTTFCPRTRRFVQHGVPAACRFGDKSVHGYSI